MHELCSLALDEALRHRATYADVRIVTSRDMAIGTRNGEVTQLGDVDARGIGVRALVGGAWGFSSTTDLNPRSVAATARDAAEIARASSALNHAPVELAPEPTHSGVWSTPYRVDPFTVPVQEIIATLRDADSRLRSYAAVRIATTGVTARREHVIFASSEGTSVEQTFMRCGGGMRATAVSDDDVQIRSYPNSFGGDWSGAGWEHVLLMDLPGNADRIAWEAVRLLQADPCPPGRRTLILDGSQLALQIHETCGHPMEVDRLLGHEASFAGGSFLSRDHRGAYAYGAPIVNLVADATQGGGLGTFGWDDEGVAAQRWHLVQDGVFTGYLTSRETASFAGDDRSRGAMRASGFNRVPLIRMVNISLEPRVGTLEDLILDTEDGIYMETNSSWSIDNQRRHFQFGCEWAWEIRNGQRSRLLKNATYRGDTSAFWSGCDAICGPEEYRLWGFQNCGKGQPGQESAMSHGSSPARFRDVQVGVGYADDEGE